MASSFMMAETAKGFSYNNSNPIYQKAVGLQTVVLQNIDIALGNRFTTHLKFFTVKFAGIILPFLKPRDPVFL